LSQEPEKKSQPSPEAEFEQAVESRKRYLLGKASFTAFCHTYLAHHFTKVFGPAQNELIAKLEGMVGRGARIARAEPREYGKSTILTAFIIWTVCYGRKKFVVYVCDSRDQASLVIQAIQQELAENDLIQQDFGDLTTRSKWGKHEILTSTNIRVMARGAKSRMRGLKSFQYRPDLLVLDDLENDKNALTVELRDELWSWLRKAALNLVSEHGDVIMVGTILHWDSILTRILKDEAWDRLKWAALDESGKPTWPEGWSIERLDKKKLEIGSDAFAQEFMNNPIDTENQAFKRTFMKTYLISEEFAQKPGKNPKSYSHFLAWDPAWSGNKKAHYTGMVVLAVDEENTWFVRDIIREHLSELEAINVLFNLQDRYSVQTVGIETVFRQKSFVDALAEEMRRRNRYFEVKDMVSGMGSKEMRIRALVPRWEQGIIMLPEDHPKFKVLVEELTTFPKGQSDDVIDALAYMTQLAVPPPRNDELMMMERQAYTSDVDEETGYARGDIYENRNLIRSLPLDHPWLTD
jgi:predicted phage terminase large subunit-like protein